MRDVIDQIIAAIERALLWILACIGTLNAIEAIAQALDTPGLPEATRRQLEESLDRMIQQAATLGCP
jgi:hypothetical protein